MKTKRFLSILLSLVLVLGMLPGMSLTASADNMTITLTIAPPHSHSFSYALNEAGDTVTASCTEGCPVTEGLSLTISAPTALVYDGSAKAASLSSGYNTEAFPGNYTISYKQGETALGSAPVDVGTYTASVTVDTKTASVSYTISRADLSPSVSLEGWTYGQTAKTPVVNGNSGSGAVTYTYAVKGTENFSETVPSAAGDYTVKASIAQTTNYNSGVATADFTISRADLSPSVSLEGWATNESAKTPVVNGNSGGGTVTYTYAVKGTDTFSETVPTAAGDYTVKASIAQTANYNAATATADFTINKAVYTVSFSGAEIEPQSVTEGEKATEPTQPTKARTAFDGWYQDADCTVPFDFDTPITADTTVYAKWTPVEYQLKSVTGATADSGHTWYKDSTADVVLTFKLAQEPDESFAHFVGFEIDGKPFPHTAKEGSTVVTLRPADLKTLSNGAHTATAVYDNGTASTRLTIGQSSASPKTGDSNNAALWLGLLLVSGAALGFGAVKLGGRKKHKGKTA